MKTENTESGFILIADKGKIVTDGNNYGSVIYLPEGRDPSLFKEITEDEFETLREEGVLK